MGRRKEPPKLVIRIATASESKLANRELMWAAWIEECVAMQEAVIEGYLTLMPSLNDKKLAATRASGPAKGDTHGCQTENHAPGRRAVKDKN